MAPQALLYGYQFLNQVQDKACQEAVLRPYACNDVSVRACMYIDVVDPPRTRRGRGLVTFAKYPKYRLCLPRPIISPKGYPVAIAKLGDHIRKRRLDLGLLQIEVAKMIGVTESTVWNWEHGTEPELIHIPAVIAFLGYVPWDEPEDPVGQLTYFKKVRGLSFQRLGALMERDPEQLEDWLSERHRPCNKNIKRITDFLAENAK